MPRAEWRLVSELGVAFPERHILIGFNEWAAAAYEQVVGLIHENRTLSAIRDSLLPKLISGEIRVPDTTDAEEVIGPAAEQLAGAAR